MANADSHSTDALHMAADWFVHLNSGSADSRDWQDFRDWLTSDPTHRRAWQRIQTIQNRFTQLPKALSKPALDREQENDKAGVGKLLSLLLVVGFALWFALPAQFPRTDYVTVKGEIRTVELADGTDLTLNTDTNIAVDYGLFKRTIRLRTGEILIETAPDTALFKRDFVVETPYGRITALGTRFNVRLLDGASHVAVYEGRVAIAPDHRTDQKRILETGESTEFDKQRIQSTSMASSDAVAWTRGMFIANDMSLCHFVAELARYRDGIIHCPTRLANMHISGAFPLKEPERVLKAIRLSLPVQIETRADGSVLLKPGS